MSVKLDRFGDLVGRSNDSIPPIVGSLFSWKSLFTNRRTSED